MCLQASGRPLEPAEAPEKASAGWMFDVGGIPIAAAWANRTGEVDQLLALAVIPHADQMFFGEETVKSPEDSKKAGCLQLWQFSFIKDKASIVAPRGIPLGWRVSSTSTGDGRSGFSGVLSIYRRARRTAFSPSLRRWEAPCCRRRQKAGQPALQLTVQSSYLLSQRALDH